MDNDSSKAQEFVRNNKLIILCIKIIVFLISFYFLIDIFSQNFYKIKDMKLINDFRIIWHILFFSILYMGLLMLLALGWKKIIETIDGLRLGSKVVSIYFKSIVYKYLPGNVFHYASRQLAASQMGIKHITLLKSNVYEAVYLIMAAAVFSVFLFVQWEVNYSLYCSLILFMVTLFLYVYRKNKIIEITIKSMSYYLLYFIGIGIICYFVTNGIVVNILTLSQCIALYSVSWIVGFIVPGAPGGIGVREGVFILLSNNLIGQPEAILIISLLRITTTLGEVFGYLFAHLNDFFRRNDTLNL